jgi:ABC-2 type transport system permease protein
MSESPATSPSLASRAQTFWLASGTLAWRELIRFFRQRTRVVGALGQPIILWVLIGAGFQGSFKQPGYVPAEVYMSFQEFFFPGIAVLILLFTAIFSTISIIEDRREGFLQGVLVAPVPRLALVCGKLTGGMLLAVSQALVFLAIGPLLTAIGLAPTIQIQWTFFSTFSILGFLILLGYTLTALGFLIAWPLDSTQGFHAIMSVFLLPMWLLSGATFPAEESGWLGGIVSLNPLTYGVAGLRRLMYPHIVFGPGLPNIGLCLLVTSGFCATCVFGAVVLTRRQSAANAT